MKLLVFWILLDVSWHVQAGVVEVNEGAELVLLPCMYFRYPPEDALIIWSRRDLPPGSVHLRREEQDDLKYQNQRFRGRTSMNSDALNTGNFSLSLRKPQQSDRGNYTCSINTGREELKLSDIHLKVKDDQAEVEVTEGAESVLLPCRTSANLPEDTSVEWTRSEPEVMMVHMFSNTTRNENKQDDLYCSRTKMNIDLLKTGDLSLTLKFPTKRDSGIYICTIYRNQDILRQRVILRQVKKKFPSEATAVLLVLLFLALVVSAGVLYHFRQYFMSEYCVQLGYGMEEVLLPCKTMVRLPEDVKVEWTDESQRTVHAYENGSDQLGEQDWLYRNRTKMEKKLESGDLSLTLDHPTEEDQNIYTCTVYSRDEEILVKKLVHLQIGGMKEVRPSFCWPPG